MKEKYNHIHFIGIGGISMSALAEIMIDEGVFVSGSDRNSSHITDKLASLGASINIGHEEKNIENDIDLVVYTSAISDDNPELERAKKLNLEIMDRAEFFGLLMKNYKQVLCVSGTHGKTTTTGMLSSVLVDTNLKPTIFLGGEMDSIGGNLMHGSNDVMVTEACEYKRNFLKFNPTLEIILNIDEDHLDYYKDLEDIESAFVEYADKLPQDGYLVVNYEHKHLFNNTKTNVVTFGKDENSDFYPSNVCLSPALSYTLMNRGKQLCEISLKVFGEHNMLNSIAAAAACVCLGVEPTIISGGIGAFKGTHRRYEYKGMLNGATIIDDYAHHPSEIEASLKTAKQHSTGKIITVFQPHTFTRTKKLLNEFAKALSISDETILLDIYSAREKDTGEIHSKDIVNKMNSPHAHYAGSFENAAKIVMEQLSPGDTIITMGAGNVDDTINFLK